MISSKTVYSPRFKQNGYLLMRKVFTRHLRIFALVIRQMAAHKDDWLIRSTEAGIHHLHVEMIPLAIQFEQIPLMGRIGWIVFRGMLIPGFYADGVKQSDHTRHIATTLCLAVYQLCPQAVFARFFDQSGI